MDANTTSALLAAINVVNDNVMANREELSEFRKDITSVVAAQGERISAIETSRAAERGFLKGAKAPFVYAGALTLVLADHWEHGRDLLGWLFRK